MLLPFTQERFVHGARSKLSGVPSRIRYVVGLLVFAGIFFFLFDTPTDAPRRPVHHGYVAGPGGNWSDFESIFSFGDSWSTSGFWAPGVQPNVENPFGNPDLPKNGSSHPPNWLHYLTLNYNATFMRTYNLAHGAATIDRDVVPPHEQFRWTHTFKEQVNDIFANNYTTATPMATWDPQKTLFAMWFGVVDISLLVARGQYLGVNVQHMVTAYNQILEDLYALGARRYLVLTAPPMYLSPSARDDGHNPFLERLMVKEFNGRLFFMRKDFVEAHPDVSMYVFDTHGLMTTVIQRPESIPETKQLLNTTVNCWDYNPDAYSDAKPWDWYREECGVRFDQYLWANHLHPTHVFHNATAAAIVSDCMAPTRKGFCS